MAALFPGFPPGPAPASGRAGTGTAAPCRGVPPIINPVPTAAALLSRRPATAPQRVQLFWVADKPARDQEAGTAPLSVFQAAPHDATSELREVLLADKALDELFARKKPSAAKTAAAKPAADSKGGNDGAAAAAKRTSSLSAAASQKYSIIVRCLRKSYEEPDGWKRALLSGRLDKADLNLLLETIPDTSESSKRKTQDWLEAVSAVSAIAATTTTNVVLLPDEDFVAFMASIPNLHQRLQCLLVMQDFDDLIAKVMRELEALADALELLVRSSSIPRLFNAILIVGNYLNEGTALGNRTSFRLETLRRVEALRAPTGGKSLLYFLAGRLGPLLSPADVAVLHRAAQLTLVQPIQTACRLQDIFRMLAEEEGGSEPQLEDTDCSNDENRGSSASAAAASSFLMRQHREAKNLDQIVDGFAAVGRRFVEEHREHFQCLKSDARRLLMDYHAAVHYFGDAETLLPFDKKVDDPQNPGQSRFVPDLFQVLAQFFTSYNSAVREFELDRSKKEAALAKTEPKGGLRKGLLSRSDLSGDVRRPLEQSPNPSRSVLPAVSPSAPAAADEEGEHSSVKREAASVGTRAVTSGGVSGGTPRKENRERRPFVDDDNRQLAPGRTAAEGPAGGQPCRRTSMRPSLFSVPVSTQAAMLHGALEAVTELIDVDSTPADDDSAAHDVKPPKPVTPTPAAVSRLNGLSGASRSRLLGAGGSSRLMALASARTATTSTAGGGNSWLSQMRQKAGGVRTGGASTTTAAAAAAAAAGTRSPSIDQAQEEAVPGGGGNTHVRRRESLRAISGYIQAMQQNPSQSLYLESTSAKSFVPKNPLAGGVPLVGLDAASRRLLGTGNSSSGAVPRPVLHSALTALKESQHENSPDTTIARRSKRPDAAAATPTLSTTKSFASRLVKARSEAAASSSLSSGAASRFSASTIATTAASRKIPSIK